MNCRYLILTLTLCFIAFTAQAMPPENLVIQTLSHPELLNKSIYAVSGKDGMRVWGLRDRIFVENEDGSTQTFSSSNSPISDEGTVTDVGIANNEIWVAQVAPSQGLGILKFDSKKWDTFWDMDVPGLLNNFVVDINVDRDDYVWLGHRFHGLSRYVERTNPTFKNYKIMHLFDWNLITSFMQQTHLWVGTTNGIIRLRTEVKSNYELNVDKWMYPEFPAREAFSICDYPDDLILAGTSRGLAIFDGTKWSLKRRSDGIKAIPVMQMQRSGKTVWIGSPVGLQSWSMDQPGKLLTEADGLPSSNITALCLDENNNLLIGTEKGAAVISLPEEKQ